MQVMTTSVDSCASHGGSLLGDPGLRAIALALATGFDCAETCFRMLYDYGAEPLSAARANAPNAASPVLTEAAKARLMARFNCEEHGNWEIWTTRNAKDAPLFKVYLNPCFDDFQRFCLRIGPLLCDDDVAAFKTVTQRWLAVRPDKFIVYFDTAKQRENWLARVTSQFAGLVANPTPFSEVYEKGGFITLAMDPKDTVGQSWRSTLLRRISAMIVAYPSPKIDDVKTMLLTEGIDPTTWRMLDA